MSICLVPNFWKLRTSFFGFLAVLKFEFRGIRLAKQAVYHLSHFSSPVLFVLDIFKMGSLKLPAWAGFEP
jgi:hypothetical protein